MLRSSPNDPCTQEVCLMHENETKDLVKKAQQKDPDAFTALMQLYLKDLYKTALAILINDEDAADAIQDTILVC